MRNAHNGHRWIGSLVAGAVLLASSVARAQVPDATWSALRGRDVVLETESGKRASGKLIDVQPTTVALVLPGGESLMIDRGSVRSVRVAGDGVLPSYTTDEPSPPREVSPGVFEWHEGDAIPPGYYKATERRTGLVIAGSVTFGTAWVASIVTSGALKEGVLAVPVAGPWIVAAPLFRGGSMTPTFGLLFVLDGVQQAVGLSLLIYGLAATKTVVRSDVKRPKAWWLPTPMSFGKGSVGLGIAGAM